MYVCALRTLQGPVYWKNVPTICVLGGMVLLTRPLPPRVLDVRFIASVGFIQVYGVRSYRTQRLPEGGASPRHREVGGGGDPDQPGGRGQGGSR